jgi:hypothetical protein
MTSIDEVTRTLADAGVRSGISAARLEAVLDSLGVLHAPFSDSVVHAKFGRSFMGLLMHGDIVGTFRFDADEQLHSISVREVITGT